MGIYKQTDTKHTQVRIEQASSAKNCSEGEMLRHFNALFYIFEDKVIKLKEERSFDQGKDHFSLTICDKKAHKKRYRVFVYA